MQCTEWHARESHRRRFAGKSQCQAASQHVSSLTEKNTLDQQSLGLYPWSTCLARKGPGERTRSQPMIRNLKGLVLAVAAVAALGALVTTAAQAHTPATFTSAAAETTLTVLPDGTGPTSHWVFAIRKTEGTGVLPITCTQTTGDGTVTGTSFAGFTITTPLFEGGCTFLGQSVIVENTGCNFTYTADGTLHITSEFPAVPKTCRHKEKSIHWQTKPPLECKVEIGEQTVSGVKYQNLDAAGQAVETNGQTITVEQSEVAIKYHATGKDCPYGTLENGLLTTSNFILTGDIDNTNTMTSILWHITKL
jgi:hypothetical protein